jgi:leucyl-tRNA synthetase
MGYDSFGLPAEQYAIQTGNVRKIPLSKYWWGYDKEEIKLLDRKQLDKIGFSFDWVGK